MSPRHVLLFAFAFAVSATIVACGGPAPATPVESAGAECGTTGARECPGSSCVSGTCN